MKRDCQKSFNKQAMSAEKSIRSVYQRLRKEIGQQTRLHNDLITGSNDSESAEKSSSSVRDIANIIVKGTKNENHSFYNKLREFTVRDDEEGYFILKRLNTFAPNTLYRFSAPVREYAAKVVSKYGAGKLSFWSTLSGKDKSFKEGEPLTREEAIALALVYRLSSEQLDKLLETLGCYRLFPRSVMDAALIYTLDTYQRSESYRRFQNADTEIDDEEFICNFTLFQRLLQTESRRDDALFQTDFLLKLREKFSSSSSYIEKDTENWTLTASELDVLLDDFGSLKYRRTEECSTQLNKIVANGSFEDEVSFISYLRQHRDDFVSYRERSLYYLLRMIRRYLITEQAESIRLSRFFTNFSAFLGYMNISNASNLLLKEFLKKKDGSYEPQYREFCASFFCADYTLLPQELQKKVRGFTKVYIRYALELYSKGDFKRRFDPKKPLFQPIEIQKLDRLFSSKPGKTPSNLSYRFRRLLTAQEDISRLMFILVYIFCADVREVGVCDTDRASVEELSVWLTDIGYPGLEDDPLKDFAETFLSLRFDECTENDEEKGKKERTTAKRQHSGLIYEVFSYILYHSLTSHLLSGLHLSSYSLYDAEMKLLSASYRMISPLDRGGVLRFKEDAYTVERVLSSSPVRNVYLTRKDANAYVIKEVFSRSSQLDFCLVRDDSSQQAIISSEKEMKLQSAGVDVQKLRARYPITGEELLYNRLAIKDDSENNTNYLFTMSPLQGKEPDSARYYMIATESGRTLDAFFGEERKKHSDEKWTLLVLGLIDQAAQAVGYLHHKGLLHLDLSPANIYVLGEGADRGVKLLDLGSAVKIGEMRDVTDNSFTLSATAGYHSPLVDRIVSKLGFYHIDRKRLEVMFSALNEKDDIYALTRILLFMLTGSSAPEKKRLMGLKIPDVIKVMLMRTIDNAVKGDARTKKRVGNNILCQGSYNSCEDLSEDLKKIINAIQRRGFSDEVILLRGEQFMSEYLQKIKFEKRQIVSEMIPTVREEN